ncbi:MAG: flagellar protein [Fimbriimonadaceae bacterium]|nr:flagellar protein [Fimbriimonadaceae bacterium]
MSTIANAKIQQLVQPTPVAPTRNAPVTSTPGTASTDFQNVLADRLKVSGHAQTRLASRDIQLDSGQWERVLDGVDRAATKGARESLVLIDDVALLVSVKNRTVITAVDQANLKENVFTNIDSAVIV